MTDEKTEVKTFSVKDCEGLIHTVKAESFSTSNDGSVTLFLGSKVVAIFRDFKVIRDESAR